MPGRWGLGPVFAAEFVAASRRRHVYAGRALFVGALLTALAVVWVSQVAGRDFDSIRALSDLGQAFFAAIATTQLTLVLLAAPAATAGGLCQDKTRGNLTQLMLTDLSAVEIVLGHLAARLVPVLGLVACTLPVLAMSTLLGGVDPLALAGLTLTTAVVAVLTCAIAQAFSIRGTRPHEVLLATFAVLTIWLLGFPVWEHFVWLWSLPKMPHWGIVAHPYFLVFAPYARPGEVDAADFAAFASGALLLSAVLIATSSWRLRAIVIGQAGRSTAGRARAEVDGRALDGHPVLWYERHRKRPTPWTRNLLRLYATLAAGFTLLAVDDAFRGTVAPGWFPAFVVAFQVAMGVALLLVAASMSLVEERARGSLDVLLTTPLGSQGIVLAKWWGAYRRVGWLAIPPAIVAGALALSGGFWWVAYALVLWILAAGAAWTSVGLALSTWIPRVGRAVAAAVVLEVFVALAWPLTALSLFGHREVRAALTAMSPFHGAFDLTLAIMGADPIGPGFRFGLYWTAAQAAIALVLLLLVLATFDRCMGRIPERPRRPRAASPVEVTVPERAGGVRRR